MEVRRFYRIDVKGNSGLRDFQKTCIGRFARLRNGHQRKLAADLKAKGKKPEPIFLLS